MNDTADHEHDERRVLVAVQNPHASTWHQLPPTKGFFARLVIPLFSAKYRTDMTQHCLLRCLTQHAGFDEIYAHSSDPAGAILESSYSEGDKALWRSPEMKTTFSAKEFFSLYHAHFRLAAPLLFVHLRRHLFSLSSELYDPLFTRPLKPVSNLGFSGSTFFLTEPPKLLIKSVGRRFEFTFLYKKLLDAYGAYLLRNHSQGKETFLCQITDVVYSFSVRLGEVLGISPGSYLVMRNILEKKGYEKWDLKPQNFFEPTRDLVPDSAKSEQAKSGLADELPEEESIVLTRKQKKEVMRILERDTEWLCEMGTIDYSILLGRWDRETYGGTDQELEDEAGVWASPDGKWVYKMSLVDFLWDVEQLRPKIMQTAGKLLPEQTVTTEPERYRKEFMKMMDEYIILWGEDPVVDDVGEEEGAVSESWTECE